MNNVLLNYIKNNKKIFIKLLFFILIGIIVGVIYFNLCLNEIDKEEIDTFITTFYGNLKENTNIDYIRLLKESVKRNILLIIVIGILGLFVFGNIIIYGILGYKGISLGFLISSFLYVFGISFEFISYIVLYFIQNIILIPSVLLISEKSYKLCKNIKNKTIILKDELCKQIIIMLILIVLVFIASLIEIYISMNFLIVF